MGKPLSVVLALGICLGLVAEVSATPPLIEENFSYTAGTLLTANGWASHSGTSNFIPVTPSGLSYSGYPSSGIGNAASLVTTGEDVNRTFPPQTSGSVYYAAMVKVSAAQTTGDYFMHLGLNPVGTSNFYARVFCRSTTGGANFGISRSGTGASVVWSPSVFALDTTHLIAVKYTFVAGNLNDTVDLFVNPSSCPGEPTPLVSSGTESTNEAASIGSVELRQGTTSQAPTLWIDGIRLGTSWADVVCGVTATGSCCADDATCTVTTQASCPATWTLDGVCLPNTCAQLTGSCCSLDGSCAVTLEVNCPDQWTLDGVCTPNTCPVLSGACCLPGDLCTEGTAAACAAVSGVFQGNFTTCSPNPCGAPPLSERLKIVHLDVGQGDGAVLISPLGQVVLFDTGKAGTGVMGVSVLVQLQALGVTHVDHHFQSHYHADHLANIDEIVNGGIVIDRGWDRGTAHQPSTIVYNTYVSTLGTKRRTMIADQVVTLDSLSAHPVTIKCVTPNGGELGTSDENDMSMVLKVTYGEFDMEFGGDLPGSSPAAEAVVGPLVGPVEVYKVHHHGSAVSSTVGWLAATQPKVAVISVGNNGYGHPTATAVTNLHDAGVRSYWTETGSGVTPDAMWDKVSNGQVVISATWQAAGVDTIRGNGFADTFLNSGTVVAAEVLLGSGEVLEVYPNPACAGVVSVLYGLPRATAVQVTLYDVAGRLVRKIEAGTFAGGLRTVKWDGRNEAGKPVSAGIYLVHLESGSGIHQTKRLVLFR